MRFLPTMQLKVQLFAGTDVADAAADLCELANRVGTLCEAEFNGVHLWARPGDDPARLVAAWDAQMKRPAHVYKIAQARDAGGVAPARAPERVKVGELILPGINGPEYDDPDTILLGNVMEQLQERLVRGGNDRVLELFVEVPDGVQPSDGGQG